MHISLIVLILGFISTRAVNALRETLRPPVALHWDNSSKTLSNHLTYPACQTTLLTLCSSSTDSIPTPTTSAEVSSITHHVIVGASGNLIFKPDNIEASIDDIIEFNFLSLNHTLTQSTLQQPCTNNGIFDTGFNQFNAKNVSGKYLIYFQVSTLDPQWFFCAQTIRKSHCEAGMVFSVNTASTVSNFPSSTVSIIESTSATVQLLTTAGAVGALPASCNVVGSTTCVLESSSTWVDTVATVVTGSISSASSVATSVVTTVPINSTQTQTSTALQATPTISRGEALEFSMMMAMFSVFVVEFTKIFIF